MADEQTFDWIVPFEAHILNFADAGSLGDVDTDRIENETRIITNEDRNGLMWFTPRHSGAAHIRIELHALRPDDDFDGWDFVAETWLHTFTDQLELSSIDMIDVTTLQSAELFRPLIDVEPGIYGVLLQIRNLHAIEARLNQAAGEEYHQLFYGVNAAGTREVQ